MRQFLVFHPFLFATFPVLFLFAYNIDEVPATDLLLPILAVIGLTLILLLLLRLVTKNYNKIGIVTSYSLIWFFSFGYMMDLWQHLEGTFIWWHPYLLLLLLWALILIAGAFLVLRSRRNFPTLTKFLNIVAIALVAISLINIGIYQVKRFNVMPETTRERPASLDLKDSGNLPDIYYIILDTYARQDTLKEVYNYDNSKFISYLTSKGFYVASKSRSNYSMTPLSMASSLNMEYINYLSDALGTESSDLTIPLEMVRNNKVSRFLKSKGYHYAFISAGWDIAGSSEHADVYRTISSIGMSNFAARLIRTTTLAPFVSSFMHSTHRDEVLYAFDTLANLPDYKEPVFVYAHIVCPHPPYYFDRDGSLPKEGEGTYIDQLIFVNKKVKAAIDEILSKSDVPPIIILQADEGSYPTRFAAYDYDWKQANEAEFRPKLGILNAYYLPGADKNFLYPSIMPVNSFRLVFNLYFGANYDLLPDESYLSNYKYPYDFVRFPPEVEK